MRQVLEQPVFRQAAAWIVEHHDLLVQDVVGVCQVPAPPFGEQARAAHVEARLRQLGLAAVERDPCGNVVCVFREPRPGQAALLVTAHLDTVFPAGTDVRVRREDGRLCAPGIGDNSAGVALLMHVAAALRAAGYRPPHGLAFVANVGEEGLGDLRGMKFLFDHGLAARWPVAAVLVLDGQAGTIAHRGIASRRLEVAFRGPGGHSWSDHGRPSAVHALGRAIAALDALPLPAAPRTTLNVGVVEGGTAVNAIAERARMVLDLRSEDPATLAQVEQRVREAVSRAARRDGAPPAAGAVAVEFRVVGDRPGGGLPEHHPLVHGVAEVARALGIAPRCVASSTDANVPLSRGIPAVALGCVRGRGAHTLAESLEADSLGPGARLALGALLAAGAWVAGRSARRGTAGGS